MANGNEPLIKLEPGGKAPILSYNVPEPTIYSGNSLVELEFPDSDEKFLSPPRLKSLKPLSFQDNST